MASCWYLTSEECDEVMVSDLWLSSKCGRKIGGRKVAICAPVSRLMSTYQLLDQRLLATLSSSNQLHDQLVLSRLTTRETPRGSPVIPR